MVTGMYTVQVYIYMYMYVSVHVQHVCWYAVYSALTHGLAHTSGCSVVLRVLWQPRVHSTDDESVVVCVGVTQDQSVG